MELGWKATEESIVYSGYLVGYNVQFILKEVKEMEQNSLPFLNLVQKWILHRAVVMYGAVSAPVNNSGHLGC